MALTEAIKEAIYIRRLLESLGAAQEGPTIIYTDSTGAEALVDHPTSHRRTKHIEIRREFIKFHIGHETVKIERLVAKYCSWRLRSRERRAAAEAEQKGKKAADEGGEPTLDFVGHASSHNAWIFRSIVSVGAYLELGVLSLQQETDDRLEDLATYVEGELDVERGDDGKPLDPDGDALVHFNELNKKIAEIDSVRSARATRSRASWSSPRARGLLRRKQGAAHRHHEGDGRRHGGTAAGGDDRLPAALEANHPHPERDPL
ncbi:retrovirus-related Pol polyprotein [Pseudoscourfieldia marina]